MRSLFLLALVAALCSGCADIKIGSPSKGAKAKSHVGRLRHVVLFKFKDGTTGRQIRAIEDKFRDLPDEIPEIIDFECGTDVSVENLTAGYTHCFLVTFRDAAGRDAYLPHPAHKEFGRLLGPSLDKVLVIDYIARD